MMSFLRRLALKAIIAAKKPSVMAAADPLQHGVDDQIHAVLRGSYPSRVVVASDLKAAFQNVSRRHMSHSLGQHDPGRTTGPTHTSRPAPESTKDAHCHLVVLLQQLTLYRVTSSQKPNAPSTEKLWA